jgi:hypothetical protein
MDAQQNYTFDWPKFKIAGGHLGFLNQTKKKFQSTIQGTVYPSLLSNGSVVLEKNNLNFSYTVLC